MAYRWNDVLKLESPRLAAVRSPLLRPSGSLQTPPQVPQWNVPQLESRPLAVSRRSASPIEGQLVAPTPPAGAPNIHRAGQIPAASAPLTSGCLADASNLSTPPGGGRKSVRTVSSRAEVQCPSGSRMARIAACPAPSVEALAGLSVAVSTSPVPQFGAPPG
jgi:hypothetical protein